MSLQVPALTPIPDLASLYFLNYPEPDRSMDTRIYLPQDSLENIDTEAKSRKLLFTMA